MKQILYLLIFISSGVFAQNRSNNHADLVNRERANALRRVLQQPLANTGNYDVVYHRLNLSIGNMTSRHLNGAVTTYFVPNQNISTIEFDFTTQMTVQSVTQRGNSLSYSQNNNKLVITFPTVESNGVLDSLTITYSGNVPNTGLQSYVVDNHNSKPIIWTLSEPYGAKDWWPCKQDLIDKADSVDITLNYPETVNTSTMIGVSNGLLVSESTNAGVKTSVWKHRYPIAAYLVAFAITNYSKFSQTAGIIQNFPIDNYVYPENLSTAQFQSNTFVPVMNYFEQAFGHYPFNNEKYGQIQFGWGGGMEHQTATFVVNYNRSLIAHELAHQWFGDAITCGSWHDIWINEGFATYSEALTQEALDGTATFDNWKQQATNTIISQPGGSVYVQDTTNIWRIFDSRLSYKKGAMVLNMLRLKIGDNHFFQGLKNYVNHKSFQYAKTNDFKQEMENISGLSLSTFFNNWIYGQGYPTYNISVTRVGVNQFEIVANQTTSHPSVSFFEMTLPFKFTDNNGHSLEVKLINTSNGQHFVVDAGFEATNVVFDEHYDIIKGTTILNQNLAVQDVSADKFLVYPNPASNVINISNSTNLSIQKIILYSLDGKEVKSIDKQVNQIDIEDLPKGIYNLSIFTKNKQFIKRIIVK